MEQNFKIEPLSQPPSATPPRRTQRTRKVRQRRGEVQDSVKISEEGKKAFELTQEIAIAKRAIDETSDIREERVREAQERLEEGYYQRAQVLEEIAERISRVLGA